MGIFGVAAMVGLFMFATYKGGSSQAITNLTAWGTLPKSAIDDGFTVLSQTDTKLKSLTYEQKSPATLAQQLAAAIATGNAPDLVIASQEELLSLRPLVVPVPAQSLSAADFEQAFIDQGSMLVSPDGGHYGLPFVVDPLVLFWNKDLFASAGVALPPSTWEALPGLVPVFTRLSNTNQVTQGLIGLGAYDNVTNARGILSTLFLQTGVPISEVGTAQTYRGNLGQSSETGKAPGKTTLEYYTSFTNSKTTSYTFSSTLPQSREMFKEGRLALYIGYTSDAAYLAEANPNLNFSTAPMPQPANAQVRMTYGRMYSFFISKGSKNQAQAYEAAALLTNAAEQAMFAQSTGLAPATRAGLQSVPNNPITSTAYASALYSHGWVSPAGQDVDGVFSAMINDVITGKTQVDAALAKAAGALTFLLQQK